MITIFILNILYIKYTENGKRESKNIKGLCWVDNDELTKQMCSVQKGLLERILLVLIRSLWRVLPSQVGLLWQTLLPHIGLLGRTLLVQIGLPEQTLLQSVSKYLRLTLVFIGNSALQESLIAIFWDFFASINEIFILAGDWALGYHSIRLKHIPNIS